MGGIGVIFAKRREINTKQIAFVGSIACVLCALFIGVYDRIYAERDKNSDEYVAAMTSHDYLLGSYNLRGTRAKSFHIVEKRSDMVAPPVHFALRDGMNVRRFDSLRMPFDSFLPDDFVRFFVGLGVGNVMSTFGAAETMDI